jgi:dehydrogenase/reductase SDR family protein 7B
MDLQNKVVWLTGASSGIGEALAAAFARNKVKLVLSARREDELKRVAHATGLAEQDYMILPLDLENQASFEARKNEVLQRFGCIDVLVNNGGISQRSSGL